MKKDRGMDAFFKPRTVAVLGASSNPKKIGHVIFRNFVENGFKNVYPVNPKAEPAMGHKAYPSLASIPKKIDLAIIATPAETVPELMEDCAKKNVKAVVVISGGFSEVGRKDLEDKVKEISKKSNIRVIGPNCIGVMDKSRGVDTMFLPTYRLARPPIGNIAFLSQSGAVGSAIVDWCGKEMFGISKFISYGNAVDVNEISLIEYLSKDRDTKVIAAYLEGTHNGRELMRVARKVSRKKPIVMIKAGRSENGAKAVASHTGSLAGSDQIFDSACRQCGIIRAYSTEDLFDYAQALDTQPVAKGNRIAIITNGGGFGVIATDSCEEEGLVLAKFEDKTIEEVKKGIPWYAVPKNPLDIVGDADAARYRTAIENAAKDPNVDGIVCVVLFQTAPLESEVVDVIAQAMEYGKPIVVCSAGGDYTEVHRKMLERSGIPAFPTPERAVRAMGCLVKYGRYLQKTKGR